MILGCALGGGEKVRWGLLRYERTRRTTQARACGGARHGDGSSIAPMSTAGPCGAIPHAAPTSSCAMPAMPP